MQPLQQVCMNSSSALFTDNNRKRPLFYSFFWWPRCYRLFCCWPQNSKLKYRSRSALCPGVEKSPKFQGHLGSRHWKIEDPQYFFWPDLVFLIFCISGIELSQHFSRAIWALGLNIVRAQACQILRTIDPRACLISISGCTMWTYQPNYYYYLFESMLTCRKLQRHAYSSLKLCTNLYISY